MCIHVRACVCMSMGCMPEVVTHACARDVYSSACMLQQQRPTHRPRAPHRAARRTRPRRTSRRRTAPPTAALHPTPSPLNAIRAPRPRRRSQCNLTCPGRVPDCAIISVVPVRPPILAQRVPQPPLCGMVEQRRARPIAHRADTPTVGRSSSTTTTTTATTTPSTRHVVWCCCPSR
jgi:hypothetical protein